MFLDNVNRLRKTIGFRLTLWYSFIFIFSSAFLFALAYFLLSSSMQKQDREFIKSKLNEYELQYRSNGLAGLKKEVGIEERSEVESLLFVRLSDANRKTVFLARSDFWQKYDLLQFEKTPTVNELQQIHLRPGIRDTSSTEDVLEVASLHLRNGFVLQVGKSIRDREQLLGRFRDIFSVVFVLVILAGFTSGYFLALRALLPVRQLNHTLQKIITTGKMQMRLPKPKTNDEIEELTNLMNTLLDKIQLLIKGMRNSLDHVAHDLRTPMTRFRGMAEMALQTRHPKNILKDALVDCLEESDTILTMLNTLMDISEAETGVMKLRLEKVNLVDLIEQVTDMYEYVAEEKGVTVNKTLPSALYVTVDRMRMQQTLANLLDNAIKYTPSQGTVAIGVKPQKTHVLIEIQDTGPGIRPIEIPRIWDRLYRGDASRSEHGLGLGLSLVKAIVYAHRGKIKVLSKPGCGATFVVSLQRTLP